MGSSTRTFLFADLAGFTALTEAHGDEGAADAAEAFFGCVRELLTAHSAEEVKTMGDAEMIRVEDAADAVSLGLATVEAVRAQPFLPSVRVGMDSGEGVERDGDWFGSAVNTAARLCAAAAGWEVLLGESVYEEAKGVRGVEFQRHGEMSLKNLPRSTLVYSAIPVGGDRAEALAVDPVCRMTIAEGASAGRLTHKGVEYEFCSLACAGKFAADPESHIRSS